MNGNRSRTIALLSEGQRRVRSAFATATISHWFRMVNTGAKDAIEASRLARLSQWAASTVRASWLYRWVTAEPEPDVIVLDLRETIFVGPILAFLDRSFEFVADHWQQAELQSVFERLREGFVERPIRQISVVLLGALLVNLAGLFALGAPSPQSVGVRLVAASLAIAGTRVTISAEEVTQSRIYALIVTMFEPPEPPDSEDTREGHRNR